MKSFLIIVFIIYYQCQNCTNSLDVKGFFSTIGEKLQEFAQNVENTFNNIGHKIKNFFNPPPCTEKPNQSIVGLEESRIIVTNDFFKEKAIDKLNKIASRQSRSEPLVAISVSELVQSPGVTVESHKVLTEDGYFITLQRFNIGRNESKLHNNTVLLHHGLLGSSADWLLLGPNKSLPYILLNEGYDVWLTNARGNYYSRSHISKNITSAFWRFSWLEMGKYDLPAVVDYIREVKNTSEQISYIGHSMGATVFLAMLSLYPSYNIHFRIGILLAPLVFMSNAKGPLRTLSPYAKNTSSTILKILGKGEFVPSRKMPLWLSNKFCRGPEQFCKNPLLFTTGSVSGHSSWDKDLIKRILYYIPAGGSTNTILHYAQMIESGNFHVFNDQKNEIPLNNVDVPITLFSSNDDVIATVPDVMKLLFKLSCPIDHYVIRGKGITHIDFVLNPKADILIFKKVLEYLRGNISCKTSKLNEV